MAIKGDFISFTYNGVHSTELGVMRVTSSNRYTDALLPTIQDKAVQAPGSHGTYFFGSYYTQRPITINVAFDEVTEDQIRLMRKKFGDQLSHQLIFDDEPYKVYYAKVTGTPQLQYIPFSSPRIYKGEGTFTFTCYEPFAHTPNNCKYLDQYAVNGTNTPWYKYDNRFIAQDITESEFNANKTLYWYQSNESWVQCTTQSTFNSNLTYYTIEWNLSANLLVTQGTYDNYTSATGFKVYNPGDIETDFKFIAPITNLLRGIKISDGNNDLASYTLLINAPTAKTGDSYLCFNSKLNLIEGLNSSKQKTGTIYNEYINSGSWFKIPLNRTNTDWYFQPIFSSTYSGTNFTLEYDYLYF